MTPNTYINEHVGLSTAAEELKRYRKTRGQLRRTIRQHRQTLERGQQVPSQRERTQIRLACYLSVLRQMEGRGT